MLTPASRTTEARTRRALIALAGAALTTTLTGCSTTAARHHLAMSGPTGAAGLPGSLDSDAGPGPSLIAGDRLAIRTLLAGGYDVGTPRVDDGSRFATVPAAE